MIAAHVQKVYGRKQILTTIDFEWEVQQNVLSQFYWNLCEHLQVPKQSMDLMMREFLEIVLALVPALKRQIPYIPPISPFDERLAFLRWGASHPQQQLIPDLCAMIANYIYEVC